MCATITVFYRYGAHDACLIAKMSMITASLWVPRGAAATYPTKYDIDEDELARISNLAKLQLEDAREDLKAPNVRDDHKEETDESDPEVEGGVKTAQSQA